MVREHATNVESIIVGAGQAGLATAYHLTRRGRSCLVVDAHERVGDVWRQRFDSLRLFTPARYDGLPGMPFPLQGWEFPTGRQMADYLEAYAQTLELPVRTGFAVDGVQRDGGRFAVTSGRTVLTADNVVVASGTWQSPVTPDFAAELDPSILQMHSADYRNPSQLRPGPVLVVGAGHSGTDIAFEVAGTHETYLSGRFHGEVPFRIGGRVSRMVMPLLWFMANHVLTERTPMGRKMQREVRQGGGPLIRVKRADLQRVGVRHVEHRVVGVHDGRPVLADGRVLDVANVIWCTGFGKDISWLRLPLGDGLWSDGSWPAQVRGVVPGVPGLYFVGLPFLRGFYSMLIGGVARDAAYVARHIASAAGRPLAGRSDDDLAAPVVASGRTEGP